MAKKKTPNDLYWDMKKKKEIIEQYNSYLKDKKIENNPHSAHLFALQKTEEDYNNMGFTERDLILLLSGKLPEMYD